MSGSKRLLEGREYLEALAIQILIAADVIRTCDVHGDHYEGGGSGDLEPAYRIANAKITAGEIALPDGYGRRDLTDKIKELGEMWWPEECPRCQ